ncbi:MAG: type II secretion system protein GspM [Candidatus Omnitrophota bacterium]|jgi:hypothetical protein|nr:type II secretion system protein GspM [Candidatus Omnitrophota bacterium]
MIRRLTKREQYIFYICLLFIGIFIFYQGLIKPSWEESESLDQKIVIQQRRLQKDQRLLQEAKGKEKAHAAYLLAYKQNGTDEQVMSSILSQIEKLAGELKLRISDLKPQRVKQLELLNQFSVSVTIDSEFDDILNFLYLLQQEPYSFNVEEVRFDKGTRRNETIIKSQLVLSKVLIP